MKEIWKPIPSRPRYEASNLGRIRSAKSLRLLKPIPDRYGYVQVTPYQPVRRYIRRTVHSLVAETFLGPRPEGLDINHKNGIKTDNAVWNLEYVTRAENLRHALRTGLKAAPLRSYFGIEDWRGAGNPNSKLNELQVRVARRIRQSPAPRPTLAFLASFMGVGQPTLSQAVTGDSWKHIKTDRSI